MNSAFPDTSVSAWIDTKAMPKFSSLKENLSVDVCIIGGGIAGLTSAYLLLKEGKSVCILEAFGLASGQTARTTAHFSYVLGERYFQLEKYHGTKGALLIAESHCEAIDLVERIVREENISCEMDRVTGYLFSDDKNLLTKELAAVYRAGRNDVAMVEELPVSTLHPGPALAFPNQMQLHPLKYMSGLTKCIVAKGAKIFTDTHVTEVHGGTQAYVKTKDGHTVNCSAIVVATNTPFNDIFAIHTKQAPYRTYVIGLLLPKNSVPKALYWDTEDPYHYVRILDDGPESDILIVGGEDHKTGQDEHPESRYEKLEKWARARFPKAITVVYRWSGQVMESIDSIAYLGHNPLDKDNVYVITGDSGNGMTHSTIGAMIVSDQIQGRESRWEKVYNPSRLSMRAMPEYLRENANVAAQYTDWLSVAPTPDFEDIRHDEGIVFRDGMRMIAAYKDKRGNLEFMSATCPHLAGVVSWNNAEKSWDCPCHGSRFTCHGKVIEGPACEDLEPIDFEEEQMHPIADTIKRFRSNDNMQMEGNANSQGT
jgi:glycine/D-amino acid oxidase-like deaminating enzyme/Rieske Fe-S protein